MTKDELLKCLDKTEVNIDWAEDTDANRPPEAQGKPGIFLCWRNPAATDADAPEITHVTYEKLVALTWPMLVKIVVNGRNITQVTRVVGYFSKTQNWNKSKIGELRDRRRGNYKVG